MLVSTVIKKHSPSEFEELSARARIPLMGVLLNKDTTENIQDDKVREYLYRHSNYIGEYA